MVTAKAPVRPTPNVGLPRLVLPMPGTPFTRCHECLAETMVVLATATPVPGESDQALYRWLLGHHGAFCVWRSISEVISSRQSNLPGAADTAAALVDSYSALLLYAGNCTPDVYNTVIRPAMVACHPAFSGTWARDFAHISASLEVLKRRSGSLRLRQALTFNHLVHAAVAMRLVPCRHSLLREAGRSRNDRPTDSECDLFESFFLTRRGPVCKHGFVAQFRRRVRSVAEDLRARPPVVRYDRDVLNRFQSRVEEHIDRALRIAEATIAEGTS